MLNFPIQGPYSEVLFSDISSTLSTSKRIFIHHGHLYTKEQAATLCPKGSILVSGHPHLSEITTDNGHIYVHPGSISLP